MTKKKKNKKTKKKKKKKKKQKKKKKKKKQQQNIGKLNTKVCRTAYRCLPFQSRVAIIIVTSSALFILISMKFRFCA